MQFEEVKKYFEENKDSEEIKSFIGELLTTDRITNFLTNDEEGKKLLQREKDSHFSKSLETWKQNNLSKLLEEEISKRYPAETEEQKRLRQIETELANEKKSRLKSDMKAKAITEITGKGIPVDLVDYFLGEDEESTTNNLSKLQTAWQDAMLKAVEGKFVENGRTVQSGGADVGTTFKEGMSMEEYAAMREKQGI